MASRRRCWMTNCSRSTRRTMSSGSTSTAKSGMFSTSSLMRASNFTFPTIPTLRPKLRKVPRRSLSIAMAFDCSSLRCVSSIRSFWLRNVFSNRPFEVKHFQTIHHCSVDVAHGLALLFGIGTKALPLWDSRTRRNNLWVGLAVTPTGRSKRTYELTSSIVPRRTSFHGLVELEYSPIVIDPAWLLCRRDLAGPTELSAINPYAVHDHGQSARQGHNRLLHSATPGDLHRPGLEP